MTKSGDQCRNNAIPGMSFCYISSHGQIKKTFWQRARNLLRNNWLTAVAVVSLALGAIGVIWSQHDRAIATASGLISSPVQSTPMSVSVGSAEFRMLSRDGIVFADGGDPLLSLRLLNGKLLVSTRVRDKSGAIIAEMNDNEWKHQREPVIFDRNYTQDVLEVRDSAGKVVLQVANLGSTVDVAAIFGCKNGWTYMVGPIAGEGSAIEMRPPGRQLTYEIRPICEYPSELHLGSCLGIERLKQMASGPHTTYTLYFPVHLCL